ncbi:MAG: electron transfer flavoprotein subunit alpha/FixB family protein [Lachnospiraceae bacterium]
MKYHLIINKNTQDFEKKAEEQKGFAAQYLSELEQSETIFLEPSEDLYICVPETILSELACIVSSEDLYVFGSDDISTELAVRLAARRGGSSVTEATAFDSEEVTAHKMVYSNHMEAVFSMKKGPYCLSLAKGGKRLPLTEGDYSEGCHMVCNGQAAHIISSRFCPEESEKNLENAKIIFAAGRGVKNKENISVIESTAKVFGAEAAVSRPAAMNAWMPMNRLIGVSGAMVSPDICITAGISGAAAFYAGIEKSKFIVAINTDDKAPIMKMADVAIVDDFLPVMEALKNMKA